MTHCLIIGVAGMLGRGLLKALLDKGTVGAKPITKITLFDIVQPEQPETGIDIAIQVGDLGTGDSAARLIASKPDVIYHLAAIVSGEAERDFEKGYRANLGGTQNLFEAIRRSGRSSRRGRKPSRRGMRWHWALRPMNPSTPSWTFTSRTIRFG